jgi:hypothetical protein
MVTLYSIRDAEHYSLIERLACHLLNFNQVLIVYVLSFAVPRSSSRLPSHIRPFHSTPSGTHLIHTVEACVEIDYVVGRCPFGIHKDLVHTDSFIVFLMIVLSKAKDCLFQINISSPVCIISPFHLMLVSCPDGR